MLRCGIGEMHCCAAERAHSVRIRCAPGGSWYACVPPERASPHL